MSLQSQKERIWIRCWEGAHSQRQLLLNGIRDHTSIMRDKHGSLLAPQHHRQLVVWILAHFNTSEML